jgi:hypothetical protein
MTRERALQQRQVWLTAAAWHEARESNVSAKFCIENAGSYQKVVDEKEK